MAKNKRWTIIIGITIFIILIIQSKEKKESSGTMFQTGYTGSVTGGLLIYGNSMDAQTFNVNNKFELSSIKVKLTRNGNPGIIDVGIQLASGDVPIGSDLVSSTFDSNNIPTTSSVIDIPMPSYTIQGGVNYSIVIKAVNGDINNRITLMYSSGNNPYTDGNQVTFTNAAGRWIPNNMDDIYFEVWGNSLTDYQSFITAKNNYLNGGSFADFVTNANNWVQSA